MRHLALALFLVLGCGGKKQPAKPNPPPDKGTDTGMAKTPDGSGGKTETPVAKKEEPPPPPPPDTGGFKLVAPSALKYAPLDPSQQGGPEIAVVSGDMKSGGGFFLKLPAGFKAPMHTHTADYHAVVVSGAPKHWLPGGDKAAKALTPGSYWFQPGGQPHDDECTGSEACVLYLVYQGGFDFTPVQNAKPGKPGKFSLIDRKTMKFNLLDPKQAKGPKLAVVSGNPKTGPVAFILEMPPGFNAGLHSHTSEYHAVVLDGAPVHWLPHETGDGEAFAPGTYWFQPGTYDHGDKCTGNAPCHVFIMMPGAFDFKPGKGAGGDEKMEKMEKMDKPEKPAKPAKK